jgi:uncharacterized DUF497 family protein
MELPYSIISILMLGQIMEYNFEWDVVKARANIIKHGVSFEEASTVFKDSSALSLYDSEHSRNYEDRFITIGITSSGRVLVVVHSFCELSNEDSVVRIISSREATKKEKDCDIGS